MFAEIQRLESQIRDAMGTPPHDDDPTGSALMATRMIGLGLVGAALIAVAALFIIV